MNDVTPSSTQFRKLHKVADIGTMPSITSSTRSVYMFAWDGLGPVAVAAYARRTFNYEILFCGLSVIAI